MSEIGFHITQLRSLSDKEREELRRHYLVYTQAERDGGRRLHADLDNIYDTIDQLSDSGQLDRLVKSLHGSAHVVIFSTEASTLSLMEFQQAMLAEGKVVRLVSENSPEVNGVRALGPEDQLIVVTTSNGFARRQRQVIERSGAYKTIVTASEAPDLHAEFNEVLSIGQGSEEGSAMHRVYATFGVTYFFDRLFAQYARRYDVQL